MSNREPINHRSHNHANTAAARATCRKLLAQSQAQTARDVAAARKSSHQA